MLPPSWATVRRRAKRIDSSLVVSAPMPTTLQAGLQPSSAAAGAQRFGLSRQQRDIGHPPAPVRAQSPADAAAAAGDDRALSRQSRSMGAPPVKDWA